MENIICFDSSIKILLNSIFPLIDRDILEKSAFIRDINGNLGVVVDCYLTKKNKDKINKILKESLRSYARPYGIVSDRKDFNSIELLEEAMELPAVYMLDTKIHLIDRRAVGIDWLTNPATNRSGKIPRYVFASIKGGVGRSTALCIAAAHLSRRGKRVLAIDFDLEAPGIGSMLLKENELPRFGSLDFLVESQVSGRFDQIPVQDLAGNSYLGLVGARVDVIPAIGKSTLESPENALAKIARAYLEMLPSDNNAPITLGGKLRKLVELFEDTGDYDFILIDSRAGLHESTAAAMLAIGGELLLFGNDQPQTFQGYNLLFSHLAQFSTPSEYDWRERITFIHSKANRTDKAKAEAKEKFNEIFKIIESPSTNINAKLVETLSKEDIDIVWDDSISCLPEEMIECEVLHIIDDGHYHDFNPTIRGELLDSSVYEITFKDLIQYLNDEIAATSEENYENY